MANEGRVQHAMYPLSHRSSIPDRARKSEAPWSTSQRAITTRILARRQQHHKRCRTRSRRGMSCHTYTPKDDHRLSHDCAPSWPHHPRRQQRAHNKELRANNGPCRPRLPAARHRHTCFCRDPRLSNNVYCVIHVPVDVCSASTLMVLQCPPSTHGVHAFDGEAA